MLQSTQSSQEHRGVAERSERARGIAYRPVVPTICGIADRSPQEPQRSSSALQLPADIVHGSIGLAVLLESLYGALELLEKHIPHSAQPQIAGARRPRRHPRLILRELALGPASRLRPIPLP